MAQPIPGQTIHIVEYQFNMVGMASPEQAITQPTTMSRFVPPTQVVLMAGQPFTLVLGTTFENPAIMGPIVPCAGLNSAEQLNFLKSHQLARIVMQRPHAVLVQNANALNIEVYADMESWQAHVNPT